jgi:hypothetical protein
MKSFRHGVAAVPVLLTLVVVGPTHGQPPFGTQPRVSPFINLLRTGTAPGINYYGLVRPEFDFRNSIQQLQFQTRANQQAITGLQETSGPVTTGHTFGFNTHLIYFQSLPGGTAAVTSAPTRGLGTPGGTGGFGGGTTAGGTAPARSGKR